MHIHIQNEQEPGGNFEVSDSIIGEALARSGLASDTVVTLAHDKAGFRSAMETAGFLLMPVSIVRELLPHPAPHLKAIMCPSAGLEVLAPYEWLPSGVELLNNSGAQTEKVGEYVVMALLMLANHMAGAARSQRDHIWKRELGTPLRGRRLTIMGLGSLGGAAARWATTFGMKVTGVRTSDRPHVDCEHVVSFASIDQVLPQTDFLLIACPLTPFTTNLMNRERLALLPPHAGVINIGRGPVLDEDALCDALESGRLGGAVLDVFTTEPLPPSHRLWDTPGVLVTPHISAHDPNTLMPRTLDILFSNVRLWTNGEAMSNRYGIERGY
ncbi:D-2-hydroxyacid dehydrogenase [Azospirillum doebereinerae]|nr:D-2-hydroxyacid dehydrogenase [Azospirillum doebereinerae]